MGLWAYYKTRNAGTRNTGGTAEHPGTVVATAALLNCAPTHSNPLQATATHARLLQPTPTYSKPLQSTPGYSNSLQATSTHSNPLQVTTSHSGHFNPLHAVLTHCRLSIYSRLLTTTHYSKPFLAP